MTFSVSFDVCTFYTFIQSNMIQIRFISFERLMNYQELIEEKQGSIKRLKNWPKKGQIKFKNFWTKYRQDLDYVLRGLTLKINAGENVGVCGRTGAGKSTIILSILRVLNASKGCIEIDGQDIQDLNLQFLRHNITLIPQDPILFQDTLKINLDPTGKKKDEELWKILKEIQLDQKFKKMKGLQTQIIEGGENLSSGEKQLVCIARAFLKKSKIILLDEATSSIDIKSEEIVQTALEKLFEDCTVITIAHRLNTIMNSDKILVLGAGKVLEYDSPQTLLKNP